MHSYEETNGSLGPNKRAMPRAQRRSGSRWVWLSLMFVGVGNCTYWSWQTLTLPESAPPPHGILTEVEPPPLQAEASAIVMANAANLTTGSATRATEAPLLPPTRPSSPNSKPAALGKDVPRKKGPVLDKMTAETGLRYAPNASAPQTGGDISQSQGADTGAAPLELTGGSSEMVEDDAPIESEEQPVLDAVIEVAEAPVEPPSPTDTLPPEPLPEPIVLDPEPVPTIPVVIESETPQPLPPEAEPEQVYVEIHTPEPVPGIPPPAHPPVISRPEPHVSVTIDPRPLPSPRPREHPPVEYRHPPSPPPPPPPPPPPYMPVFDYDGRYVVQIASFRNVEVACAVWDDLRVDHPRLFGDAETIVRPHRTQTGTFVHRLRVGAFANRSAAKDWCQAYLKAGGECFVTRR